MKAEESTDGLAGYLKRTGMLQIELAKRLRVSQATISQLVSRRRNPSFRLALRVSRVTGVPMEELGQAKKGGA